MLSPLPYSITCWFAGIYGMPTRRFLLANFFRAPRMIIYIVLIANQWVDPATAAVAVELAPQVRCNVVCPGGIDTPMAQGLLASVPAGERDALLARLTGRQLLPRFATPGEVAQVLVFLVSDESAFMTGAVVSADGGHTAW
mgnify:CR=1 FL=1